jgi:hypothetical protein
MNGNMPTPAGLALAGKLTEMMLASRCKTLNALCAATDLSSVTVDGLLSGTPTPITRVRALKVIAKICKHQCVISLSESEWDDNTPIQRLFEQSAQIDFFPLER